MTEPLSAPNDIIEFTVADESQRPTTPSNGESFCAEVKDPPTYTINAQPYFLADKSHPQSTWLLPRQSVSWTVTGSHTFTFDVSDGVETEAGAIIAKAKVKVDTKIGQLMDMDRHPDDHRHEQHQSVLSSRAR
jgi:hypothetical protein